MAKGNSTSNFPSAEASRITGDFASDTIHKLRQLQGKPKPKDIEELKQRIDDFFAFCEGQQMRPGIEALALTLGVSRQTFWNWCSGINCSPEWKEVCENARQLILTFLESATYNGKLNPVSSIFLMKNIGHYTDQTEITVSRGDIPQALPASELPKLTAKETENTLQHFANWKKGHQTEKSYNSVLDETEE